MSKPIHIINILKIASLIAIMCFHANEFVFYQDHYPLGDVTYVYPLLAKFARLIPFSGQSLITIIFFLWGYREVSLRKLWKTIPILLLGQLVLMAAFFEEGRSFWSFWEWDIYSFLCVAILSLGVLSRCSFKVLIGMNLFFIIATLTPFPSFLNFFGNNIWQAIFLGNCEQGGTGAWPLYPWLGLTAFGYAWGKWVRFSDCTINSLEKWVWFLPLAWTPFYWGGFYQTPIGPGFYCFMFYHPPHEFWAHFLWIPFIFSLAKSSWIQEKLDEMKWVKFLSSLEWSRSLGLCYLLEIILLGLAGVWSDNFLESPWLFDLFFLFLFPMVEVLARLIKRFFLPLLFWPKNISRGDNSRELLR